MDEQNYFELLNTILASAKIGAWAYDWARHEYIYSNSVLSDIHERPLTDFLNDEQLWKQTVYAEDRELEAKGSELALKGQPIEMEYRIVTQKGNLKWISDRRKIVFDKKGKPARTEGVVEDITTRKNLEELLLQSEQTYRYLFDYNPHPMWLFDTETFEFLAVNNAAIEHYGYSREEFLSMTALDIRSKDEQAKLKQDVELTQKDSRSSNKRGIWRHINKAGKTIYAEINSHSFAHQGRPARLVVARDVTEKLAADRKIKQLNEDLNNFRYAVSAAFMLLALDLQGNIFFANRNFITRLQYEKSELKNQNFRTFIPDFYPAHYFDDILNQAHLGHIWRGELRLKAQNDSICWTDTFVIPVKNEEGGINHFLVIQNDLTQSKEQEMEIIQLVEKLLASEADVRESLQNALKLNKQLEITQLRLKNAQRLAGLGNWDWEIASRKLYVSEEILSIFGIPDKPFMTEPTLQNFIIYIHPEDREDFIKAHQFHVDGLDIEYRIVRADGQIRYLHELSTVIRDASEKVTSFSGTVQDITQRKLEEIELRQQKQILEEIADVSSHIFRRPVASILGLVSLFDFEDYTNPFNGEIITLLGRATQELDNILSDMVIKVQTDYKHNT